MKHQHLFFFSAIRFSALRIIVGMLISMVVVTGVVACTPSYPEGNEFDVVRAKSALGIAEFHRDQAKNAALELRLENEELEEELQRVRKFVTKTDDAKIECERKARTHGVKVSSNTK